MAEYQVKDNYYYTVGDTWVRRDADGSVSFGISDYAQKKLKSIEYLDLPDIGSCVMQMKPLGEIESRKSLSELMAPINGTVVKINENAVDEPEIINQDPYGKGWILKIDSKSYDEDVKALMDAQAYKAYRKV